MSLEVASTWRAIVRDAAAERRVPPINQSKFRLASADVDGNTMVLRLGRTSYSEYLALRESQPLLHHLEAQARDTGRPVSEITPNVLGNVGIVVGRDGKSVAIIRSNHVAAYQGHLDLPGGHPEPDRIDERYWHKQRPAGEFERRIAEELFASVLREISEDLGTETDRLGRPRLLAILENTENLMKPEMVFVVRAAVTAADLVRLARRALTTSEASDVVVIDPCVPHPALVDLPTTPIMDGALAVYCHTLSADARNA